MTDQECVHFLQWALPRLGLRWPGFRKVRRQVRKRLNRRIEELGLEHVSEYRLYLETHPREWSILDTFCRISISRFYRDRGVFDFLRDVVLPEVARLATQRGADEIRVWHAGCASGEEVYTLAVLWHTSVAAKFPGLRLGQTATDVDEQMLDRARRATYQPSSLKEVPSGWLDRAFAPCREGYTVRPEFSAGIEFRRQDIRRQMPDGPFDLVLCRHLAFTYFASDLAREILEGIRARMLPGGVLVAGKQESLPATTADVRPFGRNMGIYRLDSEIL